MRTSLLIAFLLCLVNLDVKAQDYQLVQFSGIVSTADSSAAIPYVTITNKTNRNKKHLANYQGYFSFVVHQSDTLIFSAVGYKSLTIVIPNNVFNQRFTLMLKMQAITINLPTVRVFPWTSIEDFKREFMALQIADSDLEIAKKNLSREKLYATYNELPRDGAEMQGFDFQYDHYNMLNKSMNQRDALPLFNPFAWKAFLEQIFKNDKSKNKTTD